MEKRRLGQSQLEISILTMGCWQAGKSGWVGVEDNDSLQAMRAAYESGINLFDTAEGYGEGHSEEILAKALEGHRDEVLIATKVSPGHLSADQVVASCDKSLQRLQTDRIDLYQIHWPAGTWDTPCTPLAETMGALVGLQKQGKIRAIGVSNFNGAQIEEALQHGRIDSLQPPYSLFWRSYEENGTLEVCRKHHIGVIAYSSLAQGLLTGKFSQDNRPDEKDNRSHNILFQDGHFERALQAVERLKPIAEKYGKTTGQLSARWLLSRPGITSALVGARNAAQVRENAGIAGFEIEPGDLETIDEIGHTVTDHLSDEQTNMWG
jgi:aryl-alcohol dehydrogenase-like predicted oxidoreductase